VHPKDHDNLSGRAKLRFAVLCDANELPAAHANCIKELLAIPDIELTLLIINSASSSPGNDRSKSHSIFRFTNLFWMLYMRLCNLGEIARCRQSDMAALFKPIPRLDCRRILDDQCCEQFHHDDVATIRGYGLDFILSLGFGFVCGDILEAAKYGVWSFHYGDETKSIGGPPAFWEIYHDETVTAGSLQRLTHHFEGSVVLQKGFIATKKYSPRQNLEAIMWATSYMPARVCRDLLRERAQYLNALPPDTKVSAFKNPGNIELLSFLFKAVASWLKHQVESILFLEDWNVGIVREPIHSFLDPNFCPHVEWLAYQRHDSFLADPFLLQIGAKLKLLAEEFDWHSNRGHIVEADITDAGQSAPCFRKALDEGVHMSYPYLFEYGGRWYCTPETSQKRGVFLYVYDTEKQVLTPVSILIPDFAAVDPTLFQYQQRWWLFCTNLDDEVLSKLFVWHAPRLEGPWEPHPGNPVKLDVRSSRPAGRPFFFQDRLYRPAQDCSATYGGAITINQVTSLTADEFSEEPAVHIGPVAESIYRRGIHTAAYQGSVTVVDGKRMIPAPGFALRTLKHKLTKLFGQKG